MHCGRRTAICVRRETAAHPPGPRSFSFPRHDARRPCPGCRSGDALAAGDCHRGEQTNCPLLMSPLNSSIQCPPQVRRRPPLRPPATPRQLPRRHCIRVVPRPRHHLRRHEEPGQRRGVAQREREADDGAAASAGRRLCAAAAAAPPSQLRWRQSGGGRKWSMGN